MSRTCRTPWRGCVGTTSTSEQHLSLPLLPLGFVRQIDRAATEFDAYVDEGTLLDIVLAPPVRRRLRSSFGVEAREVPTTRK